MKYISRQLQPLTNIYVIFFIWAVTIGSFYLCFKPLLDYAAAAGLETTPTILDGLNYYTPDEGYEVLSKLGDRGRDAYRLTNYADFILPVCLFLSLSLPHLAMKNNDRFLILPLIYMISDYMENITEKYVLEIYPKRNDFIMTLACYTGLIKIIAFAVSMLLLIINGLLWIRQSASRNKQKRN